MPEDFSGQNLRGRSFKGQNLEGANFSCADIRGANFTEANLIGANFSKVKAGLQKRWVIVLAFVSLLLAGILGLLSAATSLLASLIFSPDLGLQVVGWLNLTINVAVIVIIVRQGINTNFAVGVAFALAFTLTFAFILAFGFVFYLWTVSQAVSYSEGVDGDLKSVSIPYIGAVAGSVIFVLLSIYIARQAIKGDEKYALVRSAAIAFAAFGGTSFRNANLTNANFSSSTLKGCDFRGANLTRTCFQKVKKLDLARPGSTYLKELKVRQVIRDGQGIDLNFDRFDLRGVNFQGAYLQDASFIGADLSNANLQDADLSRAKLVQTQLDGTDFTGATLTGAYIEDWNITSSTNFTGVRCEYVYMRLPTNDNPDPHRKPDNREETFGDGEFGDFIQPIFDTLDLYHSQGVDPRAIAISFKQLAENHPDAELEIVAMEKRGDGKFLLRAKTAPDADKSVLSAEYFDTYNQTKALPERDIKLLLAEKDSRIQSLETFVNTALQSPRFFAETYNNQGDTMSETFNNNNQGANIANFANQVKDNARQQANQYNIGEKQNLQYVASEIQQLLQQLQLDNPTSTDTERAIVAVKAADAIKNNPTLKARVIGALKSGGKEALKEAVDNPIFNVSVAMIEGWQEAQ